MTFEEHLQTNYRLENDTVLGPRGVLTGCDIGRGYYGTGIWFEGVCKRVLMHRLVFLLAHGYMPKSVDHVNGNPSDNRVLNLREATAREQQANRKAVGFTVRTKRYARPRYEVNCDHVYVGVFDSPEEAVAAYEKAKADAFGDYARGRNSGSKDKSKVPSVDT